MAVMTCINHPTRQASARCKRCGRPICSDCKLVSEVGVVCSEQCLDAIKSFQERVKDDVPRRRRRWLPRIGAWRGLLAIVVLAAVAYGLACWREGELLAPDDFLSVLSSWGRTITTLF